MPRSSFSDAYRSAISILTDARREKGITQVILAERLGKPQSFVAKYEGFERRLDISEFIAVGDALEVARRELLEKLLSSVPHQFRP